MTRSLPPIYLKLFRKVAFLPKDKKSAAGALEGPSKIEEAALTEPHVRKLSPEEKRFELAGKNLVKTRDAMLQKEGEFRNSILEELKLRNEVCQLHLEHGNLIRDSEQNPEKVHN